MKRVDVEQRTTRGVELFESGYNCSQSVVLAFADVYGLTDELAARVAASFGGGMGRMRLTCGAVTGMFILVGLELGADAHLDPKKKANNYKQVQLLNQQFQDINGSTICAELLGSCKEREITYIPAARTEEYYRKRPCALMVATACRLYAQWLNTQPTK